MRHDTLYVPSPSLSDATLWHRCSGSAMVLPDAGLHTYALEPSLPVAVVVRLRCNVFPDGISVHPYGGCEVLDKAFSKEGLTSILSVMSTETDMGLLPAGS